MKSESPIEIEEDEIICNCFQITENTIRYHISKNDINQVEDVTSACEAGGNCVHVIFSFNCSLIKINTKKNWSKNLNSLYQNQKTITEVFGRSCCPVHDWSKCAETPKNKTT